MSKLARSICAAIFQTFDRSGTGILQEERKMLNQLIESKNHREENSRKNGFLVATLGVLVAVFLSGWTYSLFAKNFGMGADDFELSSIVMPVAPAEEPPQPEPEQNIERRPAANNNQRPTVIEKIAPIENSLKNPPRLDESRKLNSEPVKLSDWNKFREGTENTPRGISDRTDGNEIGGGIKQSTTTSRNDVEEEKLPEVVVKPTPAPTPKVTKISGGVLNGKAIFLAKPPYPPTARTMNITGSVSVQVLIDKKGNVVSASVVSGHPLLRPGAENAARQSRFSPTYLSDEPVEVTGVIVYQFKP